MFTRVGVGKVAFWGVLALAAVLLAAPKTLRFAAGLSDSRIENEIARLTQQAIQHLQAQLWVPSEDISVESIQPLEPLCCDPNACPQVHSGYLIRLMVNGLVYEYSARVGRGMSILWCEVPPTPVCTSPSAIAGSLGHHYRSSSTLGECSE